VLELQQLDVYTTPLDKLRCLQSVSQLVTKAIQLHSPPDSSFEITTDDLIPLITHTIIVTNPLHLQSNISYMEYFTFSNISATSLGFTLVTFRAAVEFLKSDLIKSSISSIQNSVAQAKEPPSTVPVVPAVIPSPSRVRRSESSPTVGQDSKRSNNMSKQLSVDSNNGQSSKSKVSNSRQAPKDNSNQSKSQSTVKLKPPPEVIPAVEKKDELLGDFLSSLKKGNVEAVSSKNRW